MRVALDATPLLGRTTGVGRYTRELARSLELHGVDVARFAVALRGASAEHIRRWRAPARIVQTAWRRLDRPRIQALVGAVDVVHATNFVLPSLGSTPGVVTIHDLSFLRDDTFPGGARLRDLVPWSVRRARRVLTPTYSVAAEVMDRFGVAEDAVTVTHEGVSAVFFGASPLADGALARLGIRVPFAVAAGAIEPRKNLPRLLEAWRIAGDAVAGWTLVLAGPKGWGPELPAARGVVSIGWVGDETLPGLLAAADIFCYPSLYEGFGLPPLEAMAAGTATLAGRYPAAHEVLGDSALLVDPTDVGSIADGLRSLAGDHGLRTRLARAGKVHASSYTWEKTARRTLDAYREATG